MKRIFLFAILSFLLLNSNAQTNEPIREMRAVWVATVSNLDWPNVSDRGDVAAQKSSLIALLDSLQTININTIFFQVRTECDAFYESAYEPWSRYLTSIQGKYPGYDPLAFALEETHKRGMELHAWMNPYRVNVSTNDGGSYYGEGHVYLENPDWILEYVNDNGKKILNPGLPQVQQYIKEVVGDMISKYDIDGIHFDDYFYAYGGTSTSLDLEEYQTYGLEGEAIGDFRRRSINQMVAAVWDTIQDTRPFIRFGISPFGIYGNGMNPPGIIGLDAYNTIYCDPIAWLSEGTVDYINPQLYWPTGGDQDFSILLPWWADIADQYGKHVFAGHGIYRLNTNPGIRENKEIKENRIFKWFREKFLSKTEQSRLIKTSLGWDLDEVVTQVEIVRDNASKNAMGSVYFRANDFNRVTGLKEKLLNEVYSFPSIFPEMTWKSGLAPTPPENPGFVKDNASGTYSLNWDHAVDSCRYTIYSTDDFWSEQTFEADQLAGISYEKRFNGNMDSEINGQYVAIKSLDRYGQESEYSTIFELPAPQQVSLISPEDGYNLVGIGQEFSWESAENSAQYLIEFAAEDDFSTSVYSFVVADTVFILDDLELTGEQAYFWRVSGQNLGGQGTYSDIWSFESAAPRIPEVLYPVNDDTNIALQTEILFDASSGTDSVKIQISKGGSGFAEYRIVLDTIVLAQNGSCALMEDLAEYTTYYLRMRSENNYGISNWTDIVKFKTLKPVPQKAFISDPFNEEIFPNIQSEIAINWNELPKATSYVLEIADDPDFTEILVQKSIFSGTSYIFEDPTPDNWHFIRVAGKNIGGLGEWSDTVKFGLGDPSSTKSTDKKQIFNVYPNPSSSGIFKLSALDIAAGNFNLSIHNSNGALLSRKWFSLQNDSIVKLDLSKFNCKPCFLCIIDEAGNQISRLKIIGGF